MVECARKRGCYTLLPVAWVAIFCLVSAPALSVAQSKDASQIVAWTTIVLVPVHGDFFFGAPNLKALMALTGPDEKMVPKLYTEPSIFSARLDDESERIVADLEMLLGSEFEKRNFVVHRLSPDTISVDDLSNLHVNFFAAISAQTAGDEAIVGAAEIATIAGVDAILIARFWGWRKGSMTLPVMGLTKSAAVLWLGLIDGKSGELIWHGSSTKATNIKVSEQKIEHLDRLMNDTMRSLRLKRE